MPHALRRVCAAVPCALAVVVSFAVPSQAADLSGSPRADRLTGTPGPDRIASGKGADRIQAGEGDRVKAGKGADQVVVEAQRASFRVDCGPGRDRLEVRTTRLKRDRVAKRASSCEQLLMTSLAAEAPAPEEKAPSGPAPAREAITTAKKDTQRPSAPKPLNLSSRTKNSLGLGWGASTDDRGVVGYRVYRGSSQVGTTASLAYTLDSLACGTNYTVTVTAVDAAGNESNKAQSTTSTTTLACDAAPPPAPDTAAPSVPQGMAWATVTQTAIGVRWDSSSDNVAVTGYRLYRDGVLAGTTTATTYSVSSLACGTSYTIGLTAIDAAGNESNRAEASGTRSTAACDPVPTPTPSPTPTPTPMPTPTPSPTPTPTPSPTPTPTPSPTPTPTPSPTPTPTPSPTPTPTPPPSGTTRYVSTTGSDSNACTSSAPCKTLARGFAVAASGDTVMVAAGRYPSQTVPAGSKAVTFKGSSGVLVDQLFNNASDVTYDGINVDGRMVRKQPGLQLFGNRATFKNAEVGNIADEKNMTSGDGHVFDNVRFHDVVMTSTGESEGVHMECLYSLTSNITIKNSRFENCAVMDVFFTRGTWWSPPQAEYGGFTLINNYFDAPRFANGRCCHYFSVKWAWQSKYDRAELRGNTYLAGVAADDMNGNTATFYSSVESCNTPAFSLRGITKQTCSAGGP